MRPGRKENRRSRRGDRVGKKSDLVHLPCELRFGTKRRGEHGSEASNESAAVHYSITWSALHIRIRIWPRAVRAVLSALFLLITPVWGEEVPGYPPVTKGWRAAQALLARMAQVYDVPPPRLQLDQTAHYRDGTVYMRDAILDMDVMEAVLAHEFAHYLFQHKGSLPSNEVVADAKVVEILERARGYSRGEAFRVQYRRLSGLYRANRHLPGHQSPCEELRIFLTGFLEFRDFVLETGGAQERPCMPAGW